ncbi:hypothetical protein SAMN05421541_101697 [Actinoplanes philippinensis]|uniref:Uncharacterized protein n=1 Tax=Actinoplanes philippinensis TaxID=35752 RepID=A0A1I2AGC8_9ACTN|nr:hypothetical protein [Actinoplanes philippinensis]SFE42966.1 hypothetical protein SAMN05421541_101697 [Actinoplanes philippinensis]
MQAEDGTDRGAITGRHRAGHRWWRLAAAAAVVVVAAVTTAQIAGAGDPVAAPEPELPLWTGAPWTPPQNPPVSIAPLPSPAPSKIPSIPVAGQDPPASATPPRSPAEPVTPTVSVTAAPVPAVVDLSAEGRRDWAHWGLTDATSLNRRRGAGVIEDLGGTPRGRYDNNPQRYTWTGGGPTGAVTGTPTGVYSCGQGATMSLRAPAGPAVRTLRVYAGVWMAAGRLTVSVPGATATRTLENRDGISTNRFEIRYQAAAGSTVTVTWAATASYHPTCGNIDLQAATLA